MKNGGLRLPFTNDLYIDWQPFLASAKTHCHARQASNIERHSCALKVSGSHCLTVNDKGIHAVLVGRDRKHGFCHFVELILMPSGNSRCKSRLHFHNVNLIKYAHDKTTFQCWNSNMFDEDKHILQQLSECFNTNKPVFFQQYEK
jgi:coenzyme F420-reducing hydrogenase delta subunit